MSCVDGDEREVRECEASQKAAFLAHGSAGASPSQSQPSQSLPSRKRLDHSVFFPPSGPVIVFVTVCTKAKARWLATSECHALFKEMWLDADSWIVGRYVVMPNHVHLFAAPGERVLPLENWVSYWKSLFTKRHGAPGHRWQSRCWDRRLRSDESYAEKWAYVRGNPVRHGLVVTEDDWPFQGELNELQWWPS